MMISNPIAVVIDAIFAASLFINAAVFVPQAVKIAKNKSAKGISLITFMGFILIQVSAILHGYIHKDYILMGGFILAFLTCGVVTALAIKYRRQ